MGIHGRILAFLLQTGQERSLDVQTLIDLLDDRDTGVRKHSAKLLGKHGPDAFPAVPALTKLLDQPQADVRLEAAAALLQIGPANARIVEELIDLIHDRDQHVHVPAIELLGQCGTEARMAIPELEDMLKNLDRKNDRSGIRRSADRAMQRISEAERQEFMRKGADERP
jgi:HEAT repeat protein